MVHLEENGVLRSQKILKTLVGWHKYYPLNIHLTCGNGVILISLAQPQYTAAYWPEFGDTLQHILRTL